MNRLSVERSSAQDGLCDLRHIVPQAIASRLGTKLGSWKVTVSAMIETLTMFPAFLKLSPTTLRLLASEASVCCREAGEVFFQQGDAPTGLFALQSGRVKLYRQSRKQIQILAIPLPGECFGAESLPNDAPSPCTARALTATTTLYIPPDVLRRMLAECPDFQVMLLEQVTTRLRQFVALVHDLAFRDVSARLATVLLTRAETEGTRTHDGIRIDRLLSQQELASMVGTAREVINRTFKKFEQDGLIRLTSSDIFILDSDTLSEIACQETR